YKGVNIADFGNTTYDLYFKVNKKSRKEKDKSVVYLLISKGYENFAVETTDADLFQKGKAFVSDLLKNAASTDLEKQIAEQEDIANKAEKKYVNSIEEGEDLEKEKKKIEQDITDNF